MRFTHLHPSGTFASLSIPPVTVSPCTPGTRPGPSKPPALGPIHWGKYARACQGTARGVCKSKADSCTLTAKAPPAGARLCIEWFRQDEPDCSATDFPAKYTFYNLDSIAPDKIEDTRGCTPCACGEPVGSDCAVSMAAYEDPMCETVPFKSSTITLADQKLSAMTLPRAWDFKA